MGSTQLPQQQQQTQPQQRDSHSKCHSVRCTPPPSPTSKCHANVTYTTKNFQQDLQQQQMTLQQQQQTLLQHQQQTSQQQIVNSEQQQHNVERKQRKSKCHEEVIHSER